MDSIAVFLDAVGGRDLLPRGRTTYGTLRAGRERFACVRLFSGGLLLTKCPIFLIPPEGSVCRDERGPGAFAGPQNSGAAGRRQVLFLRKRKIFDSGDDAGRVGRMADIGDRISDVDRAQAI